MNIYIICGINHREFSHSASLANIQAVKEFVDHISNNSYSNPSNPTANDTNPAQNNGTTTTTTAATAGSSRAPPITVSAATAVKFLFARKFDVKRAVALFEQHEQIRQRENLHQLDAGVEPLHTELETGKFTILVRLIDFAFFCGIS